MSKRVNDKIKWKTGNYEFNEADYQFFSNKSIKRN
ncbi:hypothetical protein LCGC14_1945790 [marine sediment metagenome]|uniref:Uncharacterized protein n=1 Tax=marine sediment metagenome TaxID=412755 RepID=A0A0F9IG33_9ZZZZ